MTQDLRAQRPFKGLYQGVTRQPASSSSPYHLKELVNLYPSVGHSGSVSRPGAILRFWKNRVDYADGGRAHFFTTTDGRRWLLVQRATAGYIDVLNADTGAAATVTVQAGAVPYLSAGTGRNLRFLSLADTTFILNREVTVTATTQAQPALSAIYIVVRRVSSAAQVYKLTRQNGAVLSHGLGKDNSATREDVASAWCNNITSGSTGWDITATVLGQAAHVIKITGTTSVLNEIQASNTWDEQAVLVIKGAVSSSSDLPAPFENGALVKVLNDKSRTDTSYYVRYDAASGAWIETSYLPANAATAEFTASTMPIILKQTGAASFTLGPADWVKRTRGDDNTNRLPYFVNRKITAIAAWKGRLILASEDVLNMSQPDDVFNFWKETAKEARPADAIERPADAEGLNQIDHVVAFGNKLVVSSANIQMEVPGDKPVTAENVTIGVSTRYAMNPDCLPAVIGGAMYFGGTLDGRAALWEYVYNNDAANSSAEDLSKHVPGYLAGRVRRIVGAVQSGRVFALSTARPTRIYHHTSYWKDMQRVQSAWAYTEIRGVDEVLDAWVDNTDLIAWVRRGNFLCLVSMSTEAPDLSALEGSAPFADLLYQVTGTSAGGVTTFTLPEPLRGDSNVRIMNTSGYVYTGTVTATTIQVSNPVIGPTFYAGFPMVSDLTLQPFYWQDQDGPVVTGRWQVQTASLVMAVAGDFEVTVTTPDRPDLKLERTTRTIGTNFEQIKLSEGVFAVPVHARGDKATLRVTSKGASPIALTGYALRGRYTNPFIG